VWPGFSAGFQWVSPGGFIAVILWLIASAGDVGIRAEEGVQRGKWAR
jgi:hypothetical protein